jgi:rhamnose utilization protein RhaD (predicted bifunctional aldolase and dehydrogenase)
LEGAYPSFKELLDLARLLAYSFDLLILAEGNVSGRMDEGEIYVKASGHQMFNMKAEGLVQVRLEPLIAALDEPSLDDAGVREVLRSSCVEENAPMPSVESFMHALLLGLPGINVVAHTHPIPLLSLLCLESAEKMAEERLFPDEIVLCGPRSCYVPYVDPGLPLAREIRTRLETFVARHGEAPKTIWLENHGLIALGQTTTEARAATEMSNKAARVRLAALQTGQPMRVLTSEQVARIHSRPDEHHRQRLLWQMKGRT